MIAKKRIEIICLSLTLLFFLVASVLAEGDWAANGDNIHNTNSGNVGIGTTAPGQALDIEGDLELNGSMIGGVPKARVYYNLLAARWGGAQTGALVIQTNVPQDDHTMTQTKVILKRKYSSGNTNCEYLISGYWSTEANGGFQGRGYQADCNDIQRIRFMRNSANGNVALVIGDTTTAWSHPMVAVSEFLAHYSIASDDYAKDWAASIANDLSGYVNSDDVENTSPIHEKSSRVGIGTPDPAEKLDVKDGRLKTNMALSSDQDHHQLANDAGTIFGKIGLKYSSADLYIGTDTYPNLVLLDRSTGNVGIGTTSPRSPLEVYNKGNAAITARIAGEYPAVSASGTRYYKQLQINEPRYKIPSGITDSGYRIGLAVQGYVHTEDFSGTLASQFGAWIRTGSYSSAPSGHIINSYAVYVENLSSPNVSIDNSYGIFQNSSYAKNYFAGRVGIGTTNPQSKLAVNGTITAKEIKVESGWSDFVFDENYDLASLVEVESFILENKHLPDIPSAEEVEQKGIEVSEMLSKQMQKIEELTLYLIELKKENDRLKKAISDQDKQIASLNELRARIEALEQRD